MEVMLNGQPTVIFVDLCPGTDENNLMAFPPSISPSLNCDKLKFDKKQKQELDKRMRRIFKNHTLIFP